MSQAHAHAIWNRAALEAGGAHPEAGDTALAAVLLTHGYVMNGGVHHALECLTSEEFRAAISGFSYFGLAAVGEVLISALRGPLSLWTEATETIANESYWQLVPDDEALSRAFEAVLSERPGDFAGIAV